MVLIQEELRQILDDSQEEMLRSLSEFIEIPSVSDNASAVRAALDYILALARRMGLTARAELDGQVGVVEMGSGPETFGILAHVDVVPAVDADAWESPPFHAEQRNGRIYGRGAVDDKGPVIAALYAMRAVHLLDRPLHKKVQLILGTQEEVIWTDMDAYTRSCPLPDYGFTPDDAFPICNMGKSCGVITLHIPYDVPRDGGVYVERLTAGDACNTVPGFASAVLSNGRTLRAEGRAAHACQPENGDNALLRLADQLKSLHCAGQLCPNNALAFCEMLTERFRSVYGEGVGLYSKSEYCQGQFVHRNTISPTDCAARDGVLTLDFDVRLSCGSTEEELEAAFQELAEEFGGTMEVGYMLPFVNVGSDAPFLHAMAEAYEAMTPFKNEYTLAYGGSYAQAMPNIVAWGPLFPGETDTCHAANEYISLKALSDNAKVFALAIANIALSERSFKPTEANAAGSV